MNTQYRNNTLSGAAKRISSRANASYFSAYSWRAAKKL